MISFSIKALADLESLKRSGSESQSDPENFHHSSKKHRSYLELFFSFLYFLCIIPFKVKRRHGNELHLEKNRFQQTLCAFLHLSALYYQVQEIISDNKQDVSKDPQIIFTICFGIIDLLYILSGIITLWKKQREIKKLLERLHSETNVKPSKFHFPKCILFCTVPFLACLLDICHLTFVEEIFSAKSDKFENENFTELYLPSFQDCAWIQSGTEVICILTLLANIFLYNCLDTVLLILAISGYEVTHRYSRSGEELRKLKGAHVPNRMDVDALLHSNLVVNQSLNLRLYFESINKFASGFFLFWFCSFVPWTAIHAMESLPGVKGSGRGTVLYNCCYIAYYGIIMTLCVESKKQIDHYKDIVCGILLRQEGLFTFAASGNTVKYVEYLLRDVSFSGGQFFHLSYKFLGSTVGTVVTYAFLALQFHITPNVAEDNKG
ncbi:unnamed protein product [Orchesella dallaii]|uniref:Gustatory receptor n=1 Tax=Orchesella dallaii TaxID=48710 RepID=A0ABP1RRI4_9HEXA